MKTYINIFLMCVLVVLANSASAAIPFPLPEANYIKAKMPMHVVYPRGDAETQTHSRHRWAHPNMAYEIPIGVQGGAWPFKYELVNAPAGAVIGSLYDPDDLDNYGVVRWTPQSTSGTVEFTVRITDQEGKTAATSWKVTIDPGMFVFVKSGATGTKTGDINNPLASAAEWYKTASDDSYSKKIIVFRGGNYDLIGDAVNNGNVRLDDTQKTPSLIGFPGEVPVIDASKAKILTGDLTDIFVSGITWKNARNDLANAHYFWLTGDVSRATFWRNHFTDMKYGTVGNDNTGPVFIAKTTNLKTNILFKSNLLSNIQNATGNGHYIDIYRASYVLIEQNTAKNSATSYGFWAKATISHVTIRANNAHENVSGMQINLGYSIAGGEIPHDHEVCWNRIGVPETQDTPAIMAVMSDTYKGQSYNTFIYRNTIVNGYSQLRFQGETPFETDGNLIITKKPNYWGEATTVVPNIVAAPTAGLISVLTLQYVGSELGKVGADVLAKPAPVAPINPKYQ